jgi:hypothetical protein
MVVLQHSACDDFVTNLYNALDCGAIPIIHQIGGVPDYEGIYGFFPHVNASKPGWLEECRRIMRDDAYYERRLYERRDDFLNPGDGLISNEGRGWILGRSWLRSPIRHTYDCMWHNLRSRLLPSFDPRPAAITGRRIPFKPCVYCADGVSVAGEGEGECDADPLPFRRSERGYPLPVPRMCGHASVAPCNTQ